jgi:hypothetical protein
MRAKGRRGQAGSVSPHGLDSTITAPSRSKTSGRIALSGRGSVRRPLVTGGRAAGRDWAAGGAAGPSRGQTWFLVSRIRHWGKRLRGVGGEKGRCGDFIVPDCGRSSQFQAPFWPSSRIVLLLRTKLPNLIPRRGVVAGETVQVGHVRRRDDDGIPLLAAERRLACKETSASRASVDDLGIPDSRSLAQNSAALTITSVVITGSSTPPAGSTARDQLIVFTSDIMFDAKAAVRRDLWRHRPRGCGTTRWIRLQCIEKSNG